MSHTQTTVSGAVARSISHDEIVTVRCSDIFPAFDELTAAHPADDYADTHGGYDGNHLREVWGTTDEGDEWRVHLQKTEA